MTPRERRFVSDLFLVGAATGLGVYLCEVPFGPGLIASACIVGAFLLLRGAP